jgi:hypothetical protein
MRVHQRVRHALSLGLLSLTLASCDAEPAPKIPAPKPVMAEAMVLDGVAIARADIDAWLPYLTDLAPSTGHNASIRYLLDRHLIPLAFARSELKAARAKQFEVATALARTLGTSAGYGELVERSKKLGIEVLTDVARSELPLPEARWLFADENIGRASPVLETVQGFSIVAASDKRPGPTKAYDRVDVALVRFFTHNSKGHWTWSHALKVRLGSLAPEAIKVHPDYRDALPNWPKPKN